MHLLPDNRIDHLILIHFVSQLSTHVKIRETNTFQPEQLEDIWCFNISDNRSHMFSVCSIVRLSQRSVIVFISQATFSQFVVFNYLPYNVLCQCLSTTIYSYRVLLRSQFWQVVRSVWPYWSLKKLTLNSLKKANLSGTPNYIGCSGSGYVLELRRLYWRITQCSVTGFKSGLLPGYSRT